MSTVIRLERETFIDRHEDAIARAVGCAAWFGCPALFAIAGVLIWRGFHG